MKTKIFKSAILGIAVAGFTAVSCNDDDNGKTPEKEKTPEELQKELQQEVNTNAPKVVAGYVKLVNDNYAESLTTAKALQSAIKSFTDNPTETTLKAAKEAWLASRIPYGQTEVYRFYGGPIDDDDDGPEGLLNAWPIDESFLDYTVDPKKGSQTKNLIGSTEIEITKKYLTDKNQTDASAEESDVFTGYHGIEFMLWGQDLSKDGPGERPLTDFTTKDNADRRKKYLNVAAELLVENLTSVANQWKESGTYRTEFEKAGNEKASLNKIVTGIGGLIAGELAGERMAVAAKKKDEEDEHSCFSDNTHIDIKENFQGIWNAYYGEYKGKKVGEKSISDLVKIKNATLSSEVDAALKKSKELIAAIPTPFDQAILNDRNKVNDAVNQLFDTGDKIVEAAKAIEATVSDYVSQNEDYKVE